MTSGERNPQLSQPEVVDRLAPTIAAGQLRESRAASRIREAIAWMLADLGRRLGTELDRSTVVAGSYERRGVRWWGSDTVTVRVDDRRITATRRRSPFGYRTVYSIDGQVVGDPSKLR
jgi:hypothetical protein